MDDKVSGPFSGPEALLTGKKGESAGLRFWAKGKTHWMDFSQVKAELSTNPPAPSKNGHTENSWFLKEGDNIQGPLTLIQLVERIKSKGSPNNLLISSEEKPQWVDLFHCEAIAEHLGIDRRKDPRVPIDGQLIIQSDAFRGKVGKLTTLNEGGLGAHSIDGLSIGELFKGTISSPSLSATIHFQGEVVNISDKQIIGVKFIQLSSEARALIIAYINQFIKLHPEIDFKTPA